MIIMKFGGSSLKNAERIKHVFSLVQSQLEQRPIIVLSAIGKTTDNLLQAGQNALNGIVDIEQVNSEHLKIINDLQLEPNLLEPLFQELVDLLKGITLIKELSQKTQDYLLSFGERFSVRVFSAFLNKEQIRAQHYDGWDIGITTDSDYGEAHILEQSYKDIRRHLHTIKENYSHIAVVTGFIAKDLAGQITTLGRGGSDLTASTIGAALSVNEIQVWKDVDGILTTDPRIVRTAQPIPALSFEEASELAYFGAKVLHPLSIQPAMASAIPVRVKNSYNPEHPGTIIIGTKQPIDGCVRAITCKRSVTIVDLVSSRMLGQHGFLAAVFKIFDQAEISIDMIATSEISVSVTLNSTRNLASVTSILAEIASVSITENKSIISLIGDVKKSSEILDAVFSTLFKNSINVQMISQGASKMNIGFIIEDSEAEKCVELLHARFFE